MCSWFLLTIALVSALFGVSQSLCSPCPFQWMENGNYCYRYFPQNLSYDEAEMFCKQFNHTGHVAELATASTLGELTFIMEYIDKIFASECLTSADFPRSVWLSSITEGTPDIVPILDRTLGPTKSHVSSCDSVTVSGDGFQLAGDTSLIKIVPAPDVFDHACAVYAKTGSYLNIGDFSGTCISDPDLCSSMTWSIWLKIDTSSGFTGSRYYISSGGQTGTSRGISFTFRDMFQYNVRTSALLYVKKYDQAKIPQNKWFHLTLSFDINTEAADGALQLFVDGELIASDTSTSLQGSHSDRCTKLYLGMSNSCTADYDPITYGGSAAYSHLTVFAGLLTQQQIHNIYSCGSLESGLRVRSLIMKSRLKYECTASGGPSGPIITWSQYYKQTDSWENLDTSGDDYTIQSVNVSTSVVRSTLVMSSCRDSPTAVACTARSGSNNATVLIFNGHGMTFSLSDHGHRPAGISLLAAGSLVNYTLNDMQQDGASIVDNLTVPFICKMPDRAR
ncbi:uncharacterized protein [Asterias amurensis]|uniref:uncharacterized protein n=1 Tax=Asterias amurensis TaxID=7602 RepID=UPI003AB7738F